MSSFIFFNASNSDPTYEAWKLTHHQVLWVVRLHSDPTYEAWKLVDNAIYEDNTTYSDPTYEAWKLIWFNTFWEWELPLRSYL